MAFTFNWRRALALSADAGGGGAGRRWKGMYVTQPPCRNVKMEFQVRVGNVVFTGRDRVSDSQGVRLGLIVERVGELLAHPGNHGEGQPASAGAGAGVEGDQGPRAWFERLDCYVDGFITEGAAFALASQGAASAAAALTHP